MIFGDPRIPERIWSKIRVDADGHWVWLGTFSGQAQTRWTFAPGVHKTVSVKRVLYELEHGPAGAVVASRCSRLCVHPDHVITGAAADVSLSLSPVRTSCRRGHVLAQVGVYVRSAGGSKKTRACRECWRLAHKERYDRRVARRVRRMSPKRRATYERRAAACRKSWEKRRAAAGGAP